MAAVAGRTVRTTALIAAVLGLILACSGGALRLAAVCWGLRASGRGQAAEARLQGAEGD